MTRREARDLGREPGFVLTVEGFTKTNFPLYTTDFRNALGNTTTEIDRAEWFARLIDAAEMAERLSHITGDAYTVTAEPGLDRPLQSRCSPHDVSCRCIPCCGRRDAENDNRPLLTAADALREAVAAFRLEAPDDAATEATITIVGDDHDRGGRGADGLRDVPDRGGVMSQHTPLPWSIDERGRLLDQDGRTILLNGVSLPTGNHARGSEASANTAFIARACNAHADLLAACRMLAEAVGPIEADGSMTFAAIELVKAAEAARAAIAKATTPEKS